MRTRDFFRLIIKLFGLFILIQTLFYYIPTNLVSQLYGIDFYGIIMILAMCLILYGIFLGLIKKVDWVIDRLKLDQGFDEDFISLGNLNEQKIISLVVIFIGGILLIDYFPSFLHNLYLSFKSTANTKGLESLMYNYQRVEYFDWAISCMNIILGYLLIINNNLISNWLARKIQDK